MYIYIYISGYGVNPNPVCGHSPPIQSFGTPLGTRGLCSAGGSAGASPLRAGFIRNPPLALFWIRRVGIHISFTLSAHP